jgi:hypothetical protein
LLNGAKELHVDHEDKLRETLEELKQDAMTTYPHRSSLSSQLGQESNALVIELESKIRPGFEAEKQIKKKLDALDA